MNGFILNPLTTTPGRQTHDALSYLAEHTGKDNFASYLFPASVPKVSLSAKTKGNQNRAHNPYNDPKYARMIKEIQDNLVQKLNKGLLLKSKQVYQKIPWKELKREDFVNWPNDVGLYSIADQGRQSLTKLYSNLDRIDFTREFLDEFAKSKENKKSA